MHFFVVAGRVRDTTADGELHVVEMLLGEETGQEIIGASSPGVVLQDRLENPRVLGSSCCSPRLARAPKAWPEVALQHVVEICLSREVD